MTDRDALYRAIIANPDEDTPRFVFADWLEEHDEPEHAEFIRIGCQLEANAPDHPDYVEWLTRQQELTCWLATHVEIKEPKFPAGLSVSGGEGWWRISRRGFPRYLEFDGNNHHGTAAIRALAKSLEKAFTKLPTRSLAVRFITSEQLRELLRQPILSQLNSLMLQLYGRDEPNNDEAAQLVAECPHLKNLRGLNLGFDFSDAGAEILNRSEHLRQLEQLTIQCEWRTLTKKWFPNLRELRLQQIVTSESFEQLCSVDPFPRLHTLSTYAEMQSWEHFAKSRAFPALTCLELTGGTLLDDRMVRLLGAKWFRPAIFDLDCCLVETPGAVALASSTWLDSLRWLRIRHGMLKASGVAAIAGSKQLTNLRHLDFSGNTIGAAGLRAIAKNPALRELLGLNLNVAAHPKGQPTAEQVNQFLSQLEMPNLRFLSLRGHPLDRKGVGLLANPKFASLRRLDLGKCKLTDAAVKALLETPALQNLVELRLDGNNLKRGPEPLLDPGVMPQLGACYAEENKLSDEFKEKLGERPGMKM